MTPTARSTSSPTMPQKRARRHAVAEVYPRALFVWSRVMAPRRVRTGFNGWQCDRELAAEAEEERQVSNVVTALEDLERRRARAVSMPEAPVVRTDEDAPTRPPTGGGTPRRKAAPVLRLEAPPEWRTVAAEAALQQAAPRSHSAPVRASRKSSGKGSRKSSTVTATQRREAAAEKRARRSAQLEVWLAEDPAAGVRTLTRRLAAAEGVRISESTVTALLRELEARQHGAAVVSSAGAFAQ